MRNAFSRALIAAAKSDDRIVLLTGDHGYALFDEFRKACPEQYINAGVAEQNMVGVAAGLAKGGFKPFVYGLSAFIPIRVLEQIKLDICYEQLPVVFIGDGAGVVYSTLGSSHQSTEDMAVLRAIPHINIFSPCDRYEMEQCINLALRSLQPSYIRMGRADLPQIHSLLPNFQVGELCHIRDGTNKMCFIATGSMVSTAIMVSEKFSESFSESFSEKFDKVAVWSAPCIKPLAIKQVIAIAQSYEILVTLEEHSIYGGLGSAIAEIVAEYSPTRVYRIGIKDRFSKLCGSYQYLIQEHNLDIDSILNTIQHL
ncbi:MULTISPECIES: transketolase family protein [Pseudanabaena]|uniref:1-deoxy-D-xylulose-5-phosphate synthase n=2 Tax=Pseudanabaena TaxID=1152 RepID=L8N1K7_9CYAN|nr:MULTISPECIES: transketolase C-terminal domain-containing protein [Pseudanabaena]ELS33601.1 1-deoxy-D-xylulose-5-phosphate synthase [Pseudanabaena biceps PCC 7429]MDG3494203.1 transketolase C-terminal domain-containing protein [Pseudanabaena catenata USMAC16]